MAHPRRSPAEIAAELRRLLDASPNDRDRLSLIHEISVYQEELVAQNQTLILAQSALEEARDRFIELYDLAPTGYMTLDDHGVILQCNLTAVAFLGRAKDVVTGLPLWGFVVPADRAQYADFLRRCRAAPSAAELESELTMSTPDGPRVFQLLCRRGRTVGNRREYFTSLVDVTERRVLERERIRVGQERAALTTRLIQVQDDERQRIAQNLHDDIGQQHTAIRLKLERLLQCTADEPARQLMTELRQMFARLDQRVHFVATELRPSALDLGLVSAVDQFVQEWSDTFRVPVSFLSHVPSHVRFATNVETQLYRITQEALNNVAKHAAAQNVSVIIDVRDEELVLVVEDDGRGFEVGNIATGRSSFGLVGMRERAQVVGGRFSVESAAGHGTSVFVHVPLDRRDRSHDTPVPRTPSPQRRYGGKTNPLPGGTRPGAGEDEPVEVIVRPPDDPFGDRPPTSHERLTGLPWDASYHDGPAPWDIGQPQPAIVRVASEGGFTGAVLDAGCGTGENALYLASLGLSVLGIDVAETALAIAREKAANRLLEVEFAVADAFDLLRLGRRFKTVLDCGLFHTFDGDERPQYVASLASVTKQDGTLHVLCFSDQGPDTGPHPISQDELRAAFNPGTGWDVVALEPDWIQTRFHADGVPAWFATIRRI